LEKLLGGNMNDKTIDLENVRNELVEVFHAYEKALMDNDVDALNGYFWQDDRVTRYGIADQQIGYEALVEFRRNTPTPSFTRELHNVRITTFGEDFAVALTEFTRSDTPLRGFQSQTWVRLDGIWRIAAAHVSMIALSH
jgi:hypothetical protein